MEGKIFIFSSPSGSGKTTIVKNLLKKNLGLEFSISATSRPKRDNETDKKDYYFLTAENFKEKIQKDEFIEWEEVYENQFYGTLKTELDRVWNQGKHVIFDVDVAGGLNIKNKYPKKALSIFVMPPSIEIHLNKEKLSFAKKFDVVIINDKLEKAISESENVMKRFINHS